MIINIINIITRLFQVWGTLYTWNDFADMPVYLVIVNTFYFINNLVASLKIKQNYC